MIEFNTVTWYSRMGAIVLFVGIVPALCFYLGMQFQYIEDQANSLVPVVKEAMQPQRALVAHAQYLCDDGRFINASYYEGTKAPAQKPGQPPVPTGSVMVSLDGQGTTTFKQTISGSGVRYANADESVVFWNKGNTALIMRNNAMDLTYKNCAAQ